MTRDDAIKAIRTALRKRSGKAWSVFGGRGTAWGWITISAPPRRLGCARLHVWAGDTCGDCGRDRDDAYAGDRSGVCPEHACSERCYDRYMTPEDRTELAALLGVGVGPQGVKIAASSDYYGEYVTRAAGRTPAVCGTPYWD